MTAKEEAERLAKRAIVQPDEPVFVLVASDLTAPKAVRDWANRAEGMGLDYDKIEGARELAREMLRWQSIHGSKLPD